MKQRKPMFTIPTVTPKATSPEEAAPATTPEPTAPVKKKEVTLQDTFNFKAIQRYKINFNKDNAFPMKDIEELADSILRNGLQHNITLIYVEDTDKFTLESGERRIRAIDLLEEKHKNHTLTEEEESLYEKNINPLFVAGIPSKVKYVHDNFTELDALESKIRMEITNTDVRTYTPSETAANIARLKKLYEEKARLTGERINVNETVAKAQDLTQRQVINYSHVNNLIPELKEILDAGNITIKDGAGYSKLSEDEQRTIAKLINSGKEVGKKEVAAIQEKMEAINFEKAKTEAALTSAKEEAKAAKAADERKIAELKKEMDSVDERIKTATAEETKELNSRLETLTNQYESALNEKTAREAEHAKETRELKKQIKELEKEKEKPLDVQALALMNAEAILQNALNDLEQAQKKVDEAMRKYNSLYQNQTPEVKQLVSAPDTYQNKRIK